MRLSGAVLKTVFVEEAARLLGVSRRTVYYRIQEGKLRTIRTSCGSRRVLVDSIAALLRERVDGARAVPLPPAVPRPSIGSSVRVDASGRFVDRGESGSGVSRPGCD